MEYSDTYIYSIFGAYENDSISLTENFEKIDSIYLNTRTPLVFSKAVQDKSAPLAFVISGLAADHTSPRTISVVKALYDAGYHVVSIPSPLNANVIMASFKNPNLRTHEQDLQNLETIFIKIKQQLESKDKLKITETILTGYSIGAIYSALITQKLDNNLKSPINFSKILLINPTYDLVETIKKIDKMNRKQVIFEGNIDNFYLELETALCSNIKFFQHHKKLFNGIFKVSKYTLKPENLGRIISLFFRYSSNDLISALNSKNKLQNLFYIYKNSTENIIKDIYKQDLTGISGELSLKTIENFIKTSKNIYLIHNENDYTLKSGDIEYFKSIFKERAKIYPTGGHCGNLNHKDIAKQIQKTFKLN